MHNPKRMPQSPAERKQSLRVQARTKRRALDAAQLTAAAAGLAEVALAAPAFAGLRPPRRVAAYVSLPREPGTQLLRERLREAGIEVLLPLVLPDLDLDWALDDGNLRPAAGPGGDEPTTAPLGPGAIASVDLVLVPGLGADLHGTRLGQGGGSYDRALARLGPTDPTQPAQNIPVVVVLFDHEVHQDALPAEEHDRAISAILTPTRWIDLS